MTFFDGQSATFTVNSATQITATLPAGATTGAISVTTPSGTANSATDFTVNALPTFTVAYTDISCFNAGDGTITITASGGSGGYEYRISSDGGSSWSVWQSENEFENLAPGTYDIEVRDSNGCVQTTCTTP